MRTFGCACAWFLWCRRRAWVRCPLWLVVGSAGFARSLGAFGSVVAVAVVVSVSAAVVPAAVVAPDGHVAAQFNGFCFDGRVGFEAGDDDLVDVAFD